ncbi:hypothetical protein LXL04_001076 [Taraxacum kok-saghyz]
MQKKFFLPMCTFFCFVSKTFKYLKLSLYNTYLKVVFSEFFFATGLVFERFLAPRSRFFKKVNGLEFSGGGSGENKFLGEKGYLPFAFIFLTSVGRDEPHLPSRLPPAAIVYLPTATARPPPNRETSTPNRRSRKVPSLPIQTISPTISLIQTSFFSISVIQTSFFVRQRNPAPSCCLSSVLLPAGGRCRPLAAYLRNMDEQWLKNRRNLSRSIKRIHKKEEENIDNTQIDTSCLNLSILFHRQEIALTNDR